MKTRKARKKARRVKSKGTKACRYAGTNACRPRRHMRQVRQKAREARKLAHSL